MQSKTENWTAQRDSTRQFRFGPPVDADNLLQLFALVLQRADEAAKNGCRFEVPFAALLRLGNRNKPTLEELEAFRQFGSSRRDWPCALQKTHPGPNRAEAKEGKGQDTTTGNRRPGMFFDLVQLAVASARRLEITDGNQVCRVLAAVGQTLLAQQREFRERNRSLTAGRNDSPLPVGPDSLEQSEEEPRILVTKGPPSQVEFSFAEEEGACLSFPGLALWHASYVGPRSAKKSENQDATYAVAPPARSSPALVFALADGVSTSMGSRFAARSIVRHFCDSVIEHMKKDSTGMAGDLMEAARRTQAHLDELAKTLLKESDSCVFEAVRGSDFQRTSATRVLENTLNPRLAAMPAALNATLIGGVLQLNRETGVQQVELLRIGDGNVEHIDSRGVVTLVLDTDREVSAIAEGLGPGPRSRAMFDQPDLLQVKTVALQPGECLIVSSDGLTRGHHQSVASKVAELLDEQFWQTARVEQADAALRVLRRACNAADEKDATQSLFSDNVSLIVIRAGG